jgi:SAM-dependent methyltransferase
MLARAKIYAFKDLVCKNIEEPLELGSDFDAVVSVGVLDFISDLPKLLKEVSLALKPNGFFGCTVPQEGDLEQAYDGFIQMVREANLTIIKKDRFLGYEDSQSKEKVYYLGFLFFKEN